MWRRVIKTVCAAEGGGAPRARTRGGREVRVRLHYPLKPYLTMVVRGRAFLAAFPPLFSIGLSLKTTNETQNSPRRCPQPAGASPAGVVFHMIVVRLFREMRDLERHVTGRHKDSAARFFVAIKNITF